MSAMAIPLPLVECICGFIALLEYSSDAEVDPDVAVRGLEDIASGLAALTKAEQREFLALCREVAEGYAGAARQQIPAIVADSLGWELR